MSFTSPEPSFEEGDSFLFGLLGLIGASLRVRALGPAETPAPPEGVSAEAVEGPGAPESVQPGQDTPELDDAVLAALLGVVALGARVERVAESWAGEPLSEAPAPREAPVRRVEDLLR